ncbi:MAG TPA: hypothetical protein VIB79_01270 [Candidatus Binatia bacterium]
MDVSTSPVSLRGDCGPAGSRRLGMPLALADSAVIVIDILSHLGLPTGAPPVRQFRYSRSVICHPGRVDLRCNLQS